MSDTAKVFTLRALSQDTAGIMREIHESGEPAFITHRGPFVALIVPLPAGIESQLLASYLEENPIPEPEKLFSTEEVLASLNMNPPPDPDKKG